MKKREFKQVWIRIAGNSMNMDRGVPPYWRCEVGDNPEQVPLIGWSLSGQADQDNNGQGVNPQAEGTEFGAWVTYYGDIAIDDSGFATITFLSP